MSHHSQASHTLLNPLLFHVCHFASWTLDPLNPVWVCKTKGTPAARFHDVHRHESISVPVIKEQGFRLE